MRCLKEVAEGAIDVIDQTKLPFQLSWQTLRTGDEVAAAISTMVVRGAPLIGIAAAYGLALALKRDASDGALDKAFELLRATRPTAVNLAWALERVRSRVKNVSPASRFQAAWNEAGRLAEAEVAACQRIGVAGASLLKEAWQQAGGKRPLNVLTHCNAGWLATLEWGTALSPIYFAHAQGLPVHVWVDETRPRNQGGLTAWELEQQGVPHTLIVDNAGGLLMQRGEVDVCIVGADRIATNGDVCNKIGTYLKALAAHAHGIPFYVAAPVSTIDRDLKSGAAVTIEERGADEVRLMRGQNLFASTTQVINPAFDITPAKLVRAIITEAGVCLPSEVKDLIR